MDATGKLFQESSKKIQISFYLSGIPLHLSDKNSLKLRLIYLWNFACLNSDLLGAIVFFHNGIQDGIDFVSLTYMAPCICYSFLANFKAFFLIFYENKVRELIENLMRMEQKAIKYNLALYLRERDTFHKVISYFNVSYVFCLLGFVASPFIMMALSYYKGNFKIVYPFSITYPFDPYHIELYPVVYFHQAWSVVIVLIFVSAADYFFYTCCSYISCHFKLLQQQFEIIIPVNSQRKLTFTDIEDKFMELVDWHQGLINLTDMLEVIYAKSSLYNFGSSSALICLTLFNVTTIKDIAFILTFLSFLSICLVQIYLLCYFGDKISRASEEVSDAVYNSLWYVHDSSVGKHLLLVLMRAQKPCKLTALGFATVNQRAFMKIMSNAWSYFALLKTIYH